MATADASVIDVAGTTVDAGDVIAELGKVVDAIPAALYGKEDLYIYVSQNIARAYVRALLDSVLLDWVLMVLTTKELNGGTTEHCLLMVLNCLLLMVWLITIW